MERKFNGNRQYNKFRTLKAKGEAEMGENKTSLQKFKSGLATAMPLYMGYFPTAIAFGLLSRNTGISFRDTSLFSIVVYAGASQFMALEMIALGLSSINIIIATFLLNLRHMVMSASLSINLKDIDRKFLPIIGYGITDESFSVLSFNKDKLELPFVLGVNSAFISWVGGTMMGYLVGEILPVSLQASLGIGLYAMFAGLIFPEIKKSRKILTVAIISIIVYLILFYSNIFREGWDLILGIIISSLLAVFLLNRQGEEI